MNKKLLIIMLLISIVIFLCGCLGDQGVTTEGEKSGQIRLQSSVVELYQSSFNITTRMVEDIYTGEIYEIIDNIEIKYLFKNIAGRPIHVEVSAEFYDKNDNLVGIGESGSIYLPKDYAEKAYTPQNSIIYDGSNVADVQYALLIVEEV